MQLEEDTVLERAGTKRQYAGTTRGLLHGPAKAFLGKGRGVPFGEEHVLEGVWPSYSKVSTPRHLLKQDCSGQ